MFIYLLWILASSDLGRQKTKKKILFYFFLSSVVHSLDFRRHVDANVRRYIFMELSVSRLFGIILSEERYVTRAVEGVETPAVRLAVRSSRKFPALEIDSSPPRSPIHGCTRRAWTFVGLLSSLISC